MSTIRTVSRGVRAVWKDGRSRTLAAIAGGWFLSMGVRLTYPVMVPYFRDSYDLSLTAAGVLLSLLWMAYAVGQLPGGVLADKLGERRILVASTVISTVTVAFVAMASSVPVLFGATALFGLGTALYGVSRFTVLSEIYPDKDGSAIGVTMAAGEAGNVVMPAIAGSIAAAVAWQLGFGIAVPLFALVGVGLWLFVPERPVNESTIGNVSDNTVGYIFKEISRPTILLVGFLQVLGYSIWQAFTGFDPTYLIDVKGFSSSAAAELFALFFAVGILVQPLSGNAYDHIGLNRILQLLMGLTAVGMFAVSVVQSFWAMSLSPPC